MENDQKQLLMEILLGETKRARVAAGRIAAAGAWEDLVRLARDWRVCPQLFQSAGKSVAPWPADARLALSRGAAEAFTYSAFRAGKAIESIHYLEAAGVPVVAIKGVAAMALVYGRPDRRTIYDADLLIEPKDLDAALDCLSGLGFTPKGVDDLAQYRWFVANSPGFGGNKAIALEGPGGSEIDLHWEMGEALPARDVIARAVRTKLLGREIPVTHPADGLLVSVRHAIRENLAAESICRDLVDTAGWCERLCATGELAQALRPDAESRVAMLAVVTILAGYDPESAAAKAAEVFSASLKAAERRSARNLAELFEYQLRHGQLNKDVLLLVHSRPWRQIIRGLRGDWNGYLRSMQSLEYSLGTTESWGARASRLAKSALGIRGLQLARELARAKFGSK